MLTGRVARADGALEARAAGAAARQTRKVLILFSGPYRRPDGLAALSKLYRALARYIDNVTSPNLEKFR